VLTQPVEFVLVPNNFCRLPVHQEEPGPCVYSPHYTDKKENKIFLIYKEIQNGAVTKSYMTNGLLMTNYLRFSSYIRKPFLIYDFATAPVLISLYMKKISFCFLL
jgi:hypothetical protein